MKTPTATVPLEQAIEDFVTYCRVRKGYSPRGADNSFGYPLRRIFLPWVQQQRAIEHVGDIDQGALDAYTLYLGERKTPKGTVIAPATRLAYLKALRYFLVWARERGEDVDPEGIGMPRLRRVQKDVLSDQEMQTLEDSARNERDKLLIRVMVETGARVGEVANLRVEDIVERDRRYPFLRLRGKTGERMAPISGQLHRRLRAYVAGKTGRRKSPSRGLFVADRRRAAYSDVEALTPTGVYQAIKDAAKRAELDRARVHPHLLRASAITRMCARGMHPALVSQVTGVSVAVISMHYAYPSPAQSWEAAMKTLADA